MQCAQSWPTYFFHPLHAIPTFRPSQLQHRHENALQHNSRRPLQIDASVTARSRENQHGETKALSCRTLLHVVKRRYGTYFSSWAMMRMIVSWHGWAMHKPTSFDRKLEPIAITGATYFDCANIIMIRANRK